MLTAIQYSKSTPLTRITVPPTFQNRLLRYHSNGQRPRIAESKTTPRIQKKITFSQKFRQAGPPLTALKKDSIRLNELTKYLKQQSLQVIFNKDVPKIKFELAKILQTNWKENHTKYEMKQANSMFLLVIGIFIIFFILWDDDD